MEKRWSEKLSHYSFEKVCGTSLLKFIFGLALALILAGCTSVGYKVGLAKCAPVYGNWCGENYPLAGHDPPAVDAWDRACRAHDKCYEISENRMSCDDEFTRELRRLSVSTLAPRELHNAHSWFTRDGWVGGNIGLSAELWSLSARCEGGDGRPARFFCQYYAGGFQELSQSIGPGREGMPCAGGFGYIVQG